MKILIRIFLLMMLSTSALLFATGEDSPTIVTDDKTNDEMVNTWDVTDIVNLSASSSNGFYVCNFKIKALPDEESGVLYMADGITRVEVGQTLTRDESDELKFDPKEGFVGDASFTYSGMDVHGAEGTIGTVTLPIISADAGDNNDTSNPDIGTTSVTTDDKINPEMLNTLPAVDILNLSGKDANGVDISSFIIKSLPVAESGVLYMADGTTAVVVDQNLTRDESDELKFDPKEGFVGDALFNYQSIDTNGELGNVATVTIPIVGTLTPDKNGTDEDCVCNEYNKSLPAFSNFGLLLMMILTSLVGLLFVRKEI